MRVLTLLSLAAVVMPFVVRAQHILPLWFWIRDSGIFHGYWHNSCNEVKSVAGESATAPCMTLRDVPDYYNVIAVRYMQSVSDGDIPTFTINPETGMTQEDFAEQVIELNSREHKTAVTLSLGGPNSNITLGIGQVFGLKDQFIRLAETYGFNGVDLNLERSVIEAAHNSIVITTALKYVKYHFDNNQQYIWGTTYYTLAQIFIISVSGQVSFRCLDSYKVYLRGLDGVVDYYNTKFFDYDIEDIAWLYGSFTNQERSLHNVIGDTSQVIHTYKRMNDCYEIPSSKLVHGTLANPFAGADFNVDYLLQTTSEHRTPMRGVAISSINWDHAIYSNGTRIDPSAPQLFNTIPRIFPSV